MVYKKMHESENDLNLTIVTVPLTQKEFCPEIHSIASFVITWKKLWIFFLHEVLTLLGVLRPVFRVPLNFHNQNLTPLELFHLSVKDFYRLLSKILLIIDPDRLQRHCQ